MTKRYRVYGTVTGGKFLGIYEAASKEEAEDRAWAAAHVCICHQCSREIDDPDITAVEAEEIAEGDE